MPVPAVIAAAAENYRFNSRFSERDPSRGPLARRMAEPSQRFNTNHIAWIVGHTSSLGLRKAGPSPAGAPEWSCNPGSTCFRRAA